MSWDRAVNCLIKMSPHRDDMAYFRIHLSDSSLAYMSNYIPLRYMGSGWSILVNISVYLQGFVHLKLLEEM